MSEQTGWPPDGENGLFLGYDAAENVAILRWVEEGEELGNWYGLRWDFGLSHPMPQAFRRGVETMDFVVRWARVAPKAQG